MDESLKADRDLGLDEYDRPCEGAGAHRPLVKKGERLGRERADRYGIYLDDDGKLCYAGMPQLKAPRPEAKPDKATK